jgi:hypothetical protein
VEAEAVVESDDAVTIVSLAVVTVDPEHADDTDGLGDGRDLVGTDFVAAERRGDDPVVVVVVDCRGCCDAVGSSSLEDGIGSG